MFTDILISLAISFTAASAQMCSLPCGPGQQCALVREGQGPPIPDCISFSEALLLEQALQGGSAGPLTGARLGRQRDFGGSQVSNAILSPGIGVGALGVDIGLLNSGVGAPFGVGVNPSFGVDQTFGVVDPSFGAGGMGLNSAVGPNSRPNIGITNPGRMGPAALGDRSRGGAPNNNAGNNSGGGHNHGGANGPPQGTPGLRPNCFPCQSNAECASQQCVFSPACEQRSCLFVLK